MIWHHFWVNPGGGRYRSKKHLPGIGLKYEGQKESAYEAYYSCTRNNVYFKTWFKVKTSLRAPHTTRSVCFMTANQFRKVGIHNFSHFFSLPSEIRVLMQGSTNTKTIETIGLLVIQWLIVTLIISAYLMYLINIHYIYHIYISRIFS